MTDSFRGPPDAEVACVRVELSSTDRFDVVVYLPRGIRGVGPRGRWPMITWLPEARAEGVASSLSDVLWHAREDGARELRDGIRRMRNLPDDAPIPVVYGRVGLSCGDRVWAIDRHHVDPTKQGKRFGRIEAIRAFDGRTSLVVRFDDGDACEFAREEFREDGTGNVGPSQEPDLPPVYVRVTGSTALPWGPDGQRVTIPDGVAAMMETSGVLAVFPTDPESATSVLRADTFAGDCCRVGIRARFLARKP